MPLNIRTVEPRFLCNKIIPKQADNALEVAVNYSFCGLLRQLGCLAELVDQETSYFKRFSMGRTAMDQTFF